MNLFERYLTIWVALGMIAGVLIGQFLPFIPATLSKYEYAQISLPVAVLIWAMIIPMMMQIDFSAINNVRKRPKGLVITTVINWLVKPFTMYFISWFFFTQVFSAFIPLELGKEYLAGAVLLGAAPCTAMVFVWSYLTKGDAAYTLVQVAVNDLIMLFAFAPIVILLLGVGEIFVPWETVLLSVVLYIVIPLLAGTVFRTLAIKSKGEAWFKKTLLKKLAPVTPTALIVTLVLLFSFQGEVIIKQPLHILLIAVPLIIQTFFIFFLAYGLAKFFDLEHSVAAPGAMIGASNFFELAVAAAIGLFGFQSGAVLATVVGVLVEVPLMLILVKIANSTRSSFR